MSQFVSAVNVANFMIYARHSYDDKFEDADTPNLYMLDEYLLGLFLSDHNLAVDAPTYAEFNTLYDEMHDFFTKYCLNLHTKFPRIHDRESPDYIFQYQQIGQRRLPLHVKQRARYHLEVFSPLDDYFMSHFGFSVKDIVKFVDDFITRITVIEIQNSGIYTGKFNQFKKLAKNKETSWINKYFEEVDETNCIDQYCYYAFYAAASRDVLFINPEEYAVGMSSQEKKVFLAYLDAFSCTFGDQFKNFQGPLSDNIIFYKPIIRLDEKTFFFPKPEILRDRLDQALEYLLESERKQNTDTWKKFVQLRSDYILQKSYESLSKVFPKKHIFENLSYEIDGKRNDTGPCVIYDNKVIVTVESHLSLYQLRPLREHLYKEFASEVSKSLNNVSQILEYATGSKVKLEADDGRTVTLQPDIDYEFFFVAVTPDQPNILATNLKNVAAFDCFGKKIRPWFVNLYDLDIITDLLNQPIYFIHYMEQRNTVQRQNAFRSPYELAFLGHYLTHGYFFFDENSDYDPDYLLPLSKMDPIEHYYILNHDLPTLPIPETLQDLLLNMQKYYQRGFTKITGTLLDFAHGWQDISDNIKYVNKTTKPDYWSEANISSIELDIGFTYIGGYGMEDFYKQAVHRYKKAKQEKAIGRWITIGRNVLDKKNYATFFLYDDSPVSDINS